MAIILAIETATQVCSVSLFHGDEILASRETLSPQSHAALLVPFIQELLEASGMTANTLEAVVVSKGPGSYTGLRIGVSTAKGLCYALGIPLISVSTPRAMASGAIQSRPGFDRYCPMIDARRMEVYTALYDNDLNEMSAIEALIVGEESFAEVLEREEVLFFGDGAAKCRKLLEGHPHAHFDEQIAPSARFLLTTAIQRFREKRFEDVAYFEPYYLKDFIAGKPKVKGLR